MTFVSPSASLPVRAAHLSQVSYLALALLLGGCAVGPDFTPPAPPSVNSYGPGGMPKDTVATTLPGGAGQSFKPGAAVPSDWWTLFHNEALDALIAEALRSNPDLQAARATLRAAEEDAAAARGAWWPSLDGSASANGQQGSGNAANPSVKTVPSFTLYNASVSVSYALDLFGLTARAVEGAEAGTDASRAALRAARLTLAGNVATAAITEASLRARLDATDDIIRTSREQLDLINRQFELGATSKSDVLAEQAQLAAVEAGRPDLERQLASTRHLLSVLTGRPPSEDVGTTFALDALTLPDSLPVSLPSELVRQRPDIQEAEANLHAASAGIGAAMAARLPQITLTGSYGASSQQLANLLEPASATWGLGAGLLQPIFQGGTLWHRQRSAEATFDAAAARYRSTVLAAFQNVADVLRALEADADTLKARAAAENAAEASYTLSREQYGAGAISYSTLLAAEQTWQQARIALAAARAQRFSDTAALFVALGGGWWTAPDKDDSMAMAPLSEAPPNTPKDIAVSGDKP